MANIGSFKKSGSEFQGVIVTLSVQTKGVRIVPETTRANDNAPSHRVFVGRAESAPPGRSAPPKVANTSRSTGRSSFNAPIYANLFDDEDGKGFTLIWSRSRKPAATEPHPPAPRPEFGRGLARTACAAMASRFSPPTAERGKCARGRPSTATRLGFAP